MKEIKRQAKDTVSVMTLGASNKAGQVLNPNIPQPEDPKVAPVADDEASKMANRRKAAKRRAGGRAGTILTEGSTLG